MPICNICLIDKPQDQFYKAATHHRDGRPADNWYRKTCKECQYQTQRRRIQSLSREEKDRRNAIHRAWYRRTKESNDPKSTAKQAEYERTYNNTPRGRASEMYKAMVYRCGKQKHYENIRVEMSREDFLTWAIPELEDFKQRYPDKVPSIDRINPDGNYAFGNMRIIDKLYNKIRSRYIVNSYGLGKDSEESEVFEAVAMVVQSLCENTGKDVTRCIDFISNAI